MVGTLNLNNCLISGCEWPIQIWQPYESWFANLTHCTVDQADALSATISQCPVWVNAKNCVFANISMQPQTPIGGDYNGFYNAPLFGTHQFQDDQSPFQSNGFIDSNGHQHYYVVNGQGAYYLRDGSPFIEVGGTNITSSLRADIARRTTRLPELLMDDLTTARP